jgi:pimeloyl-ACP methyl ester carboxylesterase
VAYDRRGYGQSFDLGPPPDFDCQVDDLVAVLDGEPAVAFGHSFGGDIVLATMARHPGIIPAAVIWEPPQPWLPWWKVGSHTWAADTEATPADRAEAFMRRMVGDMVWERLPAGTRDQRRAEGATLLAELISLSEKQPFDPSRILAPVMVGRGSESSTRHRRAARELAASLPNGELVDVEGASHGVHLSHPAEVADLINRALLATTPGSQVDRTEGGGG